MVVLREQTDRSSCAALRAQFDDHCLGRTSTRYLQRKARSQLRFSRSGRALGAPRGSGGAPPADPSDPSRLDSRASKVAQPSRSSRALGAHGRPRASSFDERDLASADWRGIQRAEGGSGSMRQALSEASGGGQHGCPSDVAGEASASPVWPARRRSLSPPRSPRRDLAVPRDPALRASPTRAGGRMHSHLAAGRGGRAEEKASEALARFGTEQLGSRPGRPGEGGVDDGTGGQGLRRRTSGSANAAPHDSSSPHLTPQDEPSQPPVGRRCGPGSLRTLTRLGRLHTPAFAVPSSQPAHTRRLGGSLCAQWYVLAAWAPPPARPMAHSPHFAPWLASHSGACPRHVARPVVLPRSLNFDRSIV